MANARLNRDSSTTAAAFRQFLSWLDDGTDSNGEKYLEMRRRLVAYFDRKNCVAPDELADETLNRVARRLEEEGSITGTAPPNIATSPLNSSSSSISVATRGPTPACRELSPGEVDAVLGAAPADDEAQNKEHLSACLEECLTKLPSNDRDLILEYYRGEQRSKIESRRGLAATLRLSVNALSIRACRIRNKLELCVRECSNP